MANKLVDIFDEDNKPLKLQKMLKEVHLNGEWHRVAHIWIYNSKGDILLQKRSRKKKLYPDMLDVSLHVHVSANELPIVTAIKALEEKRGISTVKSKLTLLGIRKSQTKYEHVNNNEYFYIYAYRLDGKLEDLNIKEDRIQLLQFYSIAKVEKELKMTTGKYTPRGEYWQFVLSEIKKLSNCKR